ncbi:MAG: DNA-directed RNA polymerase subunit alpha [Patescibacteria group bacterium]
MEDIIQPSKIFTKDEKGNEATIIIEPCYPGYGSTLGNALRRVLLSSLPGCAVSQIKIKGVDHEFSTVSFIKEDVIEIILNLKRLRLKIFHDEPVRLKLQSEGEKIIRASDIKKDAAVSIINPELVIAHATDKKAKLEIEIIVEKGRGYVPVEQKNSKDLEIGMINVDSIFTSVVSVGYEVENMRVGKRIDFDRLIMKIKTDGSITPLEAFIQAAKILQKQFIVLSEPEKLKEKAKEIEEIKKEEKTEVKLPVGIGEVSLGELNFSTRTFNALARAKIQTLVDVASKSEKELLKLTGFGQTALSEVKRALKKYNVELKP